MPTEKGQWKTVKAIEVGASGLQFLITQLKDNPIQANLIRVRKSGKTVAARRIENDEFPLLSKAIPEVEKLLAADDKRVVAAKAKAAKAAKGNGGAKKADAKKSDKALDKFHKGKKPVKASGKKTDAGKKAGTKKASSKKPVATAAGKKDVSLDDIL